MDHESLCKKATDRLQGDEARFDLFDASVCLAQWQIASSLLPRERDTFQGPTKVRVGDGQVRLITESANCHQLPEYLKLPTAREEAAIRVPLDGLLHAKANGCIPDIIRSISPRGSLRVEDFWSADLITLGMVYGPLQPVEANSAIPLSPLTETFEKKQGARDGRNLGLNVRKTIPPITVLMTTPHALENPLPLLHFPCASSCRSSSGLQNPRFLVLAERYEFGKFPLFLSGWWLCAPLHFKPPHLGRVKLPARAVL